MKVIKEIRSVFGDWMDFQGQKRAEKYFQMLIVVPSVIGFLLGLLLNDFKVTFYFWLVGTILAIILCVPSWPMYRRNPIEWVEAPKEEMEEIDYEDMNLLQKIAYHVKAILARFNGESNTARVAESVPPNRDANSKKRR